MNSRKRILAAFYLEEPDLVPVSTYMSPYWLENRWVNEERFWNFVKKSDAIFRVSLGKMYDIDRNKVKVIDKTFIEGNRCVTLQRIEYCNNILQSVVESVGYSRRIVEGFLKTEEDVKMWLSIPYTIVAVDPKPFFYWDEKLGDEGITVCSISDPIGEAWNLFSTRDFLKYCVSKPHLIEEIVKELLRRKMEALPSILEKGVTRFWISGSEVVGPTFVNPKYFARFATRYDKELIKLIHEYGGIAYVHCHGKITQILQEFLEMEADVLDPLDPPPQGDVSLSYAKKFIGNKICLVGNVDSNNVMVQGTPEIVTSAVKKCIEEAAYGGGYILQPTSGSIFDTPLENIETLIKAGRKYGKYKLSIHVI
ncbi:MAG: uroporphyrinogen decarboxylase family protein [Candidatus Bathyarchaeia archaeon]